MKNILTAFLIMIVFTILLGIIYPFIILGIGQVFFNYQANGSLIKENGQIIGSALIQQEFTSPEFFHGRPDSFGIDDYPTSIKMVQIIKNRIAESQKNNMQPASKIVPITLITDSGSGMDPDITPDAAFYQAKRISQLRKIPITQINNLISNSIKVRQLGFLGEPTVNVLELNLKLNRLASNN